MIVAHLAPEDRKNIKEIRQKIAKALQTLNLISNLSDINHEARVALHHKMGNILQKILWTKTTIINNSEELMEPRYRAQIKQALLGLEKALEAHRPFFEAKVDLVKIRKGLRSIHEKNSIMNEVKAIAKITKIEDSTLYSYKTQLLLSIMAILLCVRLGFLLAQTSTARQKASSKPRSINDDFDDHIRKKMLMTRI